MIEMKLTALKLGLDRKGGGGKKYICLLTKNPDMKSWTPPLLQIFYIFSELERMNLTQLLPPFFTMSFILPFFLFEVVPKQESKKASKQVSK